MLNTENAFLLGEVAAPPRAAPRHRGSRCIDCYDVIAARFTTSISSSESLWYFWFLTHFAMCAVGAVYKQVFFWVFHCSYPFEDYKVKVLFYPMFHDFQKSTAFWKAPRLLSFVLLVRATCTWRWMWMILTGENLSSQRQPCSTVTLTTTKLTSIRLGSNSDLRCERAGDCPPEP